MMKILLHINLALILGWIFFHLLPLKAISCRSKTKVARNILLSSLLSVFLFGVLPDIFFPNFFGDLKVAPIRGVDSFVLNSSIYQISQGFSTLPQTGVVKSQPDGLANLEHFFLLGCLFFVLRFVLNLYRLIGLVKKSLIVHKIGKTLVSVSDITTVPFSTLLFGKAHIVLPSNLLIHQKEYKIALRHEAEHHRQGDTGWTLFMEILSCFFYYNPFFYLWRKTMMQLQELACDESLISQMGISKQDYGSCLLKVAEMALGNRKMYVGTTCMLPWTKSNDHSFLIRRIKMFDKHEKANLNKRRSLLIGTLLTTIIFGGVYIAHAMTRLDTKVNPGTPVFHQKIQRVTEEILAKGLQKYKAAAGFAIVADPLTGVILAAANINNGFDDSLPQNWALSYPMQPASAIKPLLLASAIQENVTTLEETHDCEGGVFQFGGQLVKDYKAFDQLSSLEAVAMSSNICSIKIGQKLGASSIEKSLRALGFGRGGVTKSFPSARSGRVPLVQAMDEDQYILLSQGFSEKTDFYVTPLEMVQAYSAIANGGKLVRPLEFSGRPISQTIRKVFSQQTSKDLQLTLRKAVTSGTGQTIKNSKVSLAGKTLTVNMSGDRRVTGFIGYGPADAPKLVSYVVLFDLKEKLAGSTTAAPIFKEVMEKTLSISSH